MNYVPANLRDPDNRKVTVLVFMLPWCESYLEQSRPSASETCRQVREQMESLHQQQGELRLLGINSGLWTLEQDLRNYADDYGTTIPLALDADNVLFRAFGVMTVPTVIVADAEGRIVKRVDGFDPALVAEL